MKDEQIIVCTIPKQNTKKDNDCSICHEEIDVQVFEGGGTWAGGHNAEPINDGTCCTKCNDTIVTPTRIKQYMKGE